MMNRVKITIEYIAEMIESVSKLETGNRYRDQNGNEFGTKSEFIASINKTIDEEILKLYEQIKEDYKLKNFK